MRTHTITILAITAALATTGCTGRGPLRLTEKQSILPATTAPTSKSDIELAPNESAKLMLNMAAGLEKDGKDADALAYYEKAKQLDPNLAEGLTHRTAVLNDKIDRQDTAMTAFQAALAKNPKDPALLNDIGYSYYNRANWVEAETYLRKAVDADTNNKTAWNNLGMALAQQGKHDDAISAWTKAVTPAEAHSNLGFILLTQGKKDAARASYQKALQLEPTLRIAKLGLERVDAPPAPAKDATAAAN
jgi:Tfp pilus assembly protein PilF